MKTKRAFLLLGVLMMVLITAITAVLSAFGGPAIETTAFGIAESSPDGKHFASALHMKSEKDGKPFQNWFEVQLGSKEAGLEKIWSFPKKAGKAEHFQTDDFGVEWSEDSKQLQVWMPSVALRLEL